VACYLNEPSRAGSLSTPRLIGLAGKTYRKSRPYIENQILTEEFKEEGLKKVICQMSHNKAPGPEGLTTEFSKPFGRS
jgi:hypothetical protein